MPGVRMDTVLIMVAQASALVVFGVLLTLWQGATGTVVAVGINIAIGFTLSAAYIFRNLPLSVGDVFGPPLISLAAASLLTLALSRHPVGLN